MNIYIYIKETLDYIMVASRNEPITYRYDQHSFSRISILLNLDETLKCRQLVWKNVEIKSKT